MTPEQREVIKRIVLQVPMDWLAAAPGTAEVKDLRLTVADLVTLYALATASQREDAAHWGTGS